MLSRAVFLFLFLALSTAAAQLWATPQVTAQNPLLAGFKAKGNTFTRGQATVTLDVVAGQVIGVYALAPQGDTDAVARALLTAWGGGNADLAGLTKTLGQPGLQLRARMQGGLRQSATQDGSDLLALHLRGEGAKAQWQAYAAINIQPPSAFPKTRNVSGKATAPNDLHVLSDFQCPYCQKLWNEVLPTWEKDPKTYRVSHLHFPLDFHGNAFLAAEASECAAAQGKFWPYADRLFREFRMWTPLPGGEVPQRFTSYARQLKLNPALFQACLEKHQFRATVNAQLNAGKKLGVRGTPTVFLNGVKMSDYSSPTEAARIKSVTTGKITALTVVTKRLAQFR